MAASPKQARAWMEQWRMAGVELAKQRKTELRSMTHAQALAAADALLSLADPTRLPERRRVTSGLVEQQALLHRHRP